MEVNKEDRVKESSYKPLDLFVSQDDSNTDLLAHSVNLHRLFAT